MSERNLGPGLQAEPEDPEALALLRSLNALLASWLDPYRTLMRLSRSRSTDKVFNDAVWGTIRLFPWEVAILDSPVMQRLRGLRQLGVVHWVYPNAAHSRFEHSVGAVHQVQALMDGIERSSGRAEDEFIPDADVKLLRLTALLHDCGHVAFSHVGERHLKSVPGLHELQKWFRREYSADKASPSETLAAIVVRSPAFVALLQEPAVGADFIRDKERAARQIAGMVLGAPAVLERAFLGELISGPYDADKLDYMVRDAYMAGLPASVDVRRITDKIQCVMVPDGEGVTKEAKEARKRHLPSPGVAVPVIALPRSGAAVLRELARARSSLFEKMYYHQKVRALEAAALRAMAAHADRVEATQPLWWFTAGDEEIVAGDEGAWSLRWRRPPKRAAFLPPPPGPVEDNGSTNAPSSPMTTLWAKLHMPKLYAAFADEIAAEAGRLAAAVGRPLQAPPCFDFPNWERGKFDERALVGDVASELVRPRPQETGERSKTAETYAREGAYVYASEADLEVVHLATLSVLAQKHMVTSTADMLDRTNVDRVALGNVEQELHAVGALTGDRWYAGAATTIRKARSIENFLRSAHSRIQDLGNKFGQYQPIGRGPIGPADVAGYLRQYETIDRARAMLDVLETIEVRGRDSLKTSLIATLTRLEADGARPDVICPLGGVGDSSAWLFYFIGDLGSSRPRVMPIELALDDPSCQHILLWDDFCGQGGHTLTTLHQWSGGALAAPDARLHLNEDLGSSIGADRWARLVGRRLSISFAVARPDGLTQVRHHLAATGMSRATVLDPADTVADDDGFLNDTTVIADGAVRDDLREFLRDKARVVLAPKARESGWDAAKLSDRCLGYGNHQHRVVFFYNVPSVTLTLLWAELDGVWRPLFPRRPKSRA